MPGKANAESVHVRYYHDEARLRCDDIALVLGVLSLLKALGFSPNRNSGTASTGASAFATEKGRKQQERGHEAASAFKRHNLLFARIDRALLGVPSGLAIQFPWA